MKNEFIAINGKLESMTKKEAKEKIISFGYSFQQDINTKTTIVVNGAHPLKKKKQKIKELEKKGQIIKIITEEEFIELLKPKKSSNKFLTIIKTKTKKIKEKISINIQNNNDKKQNSQITNTVKNTSKKITNSVKNTSKKITKSSEEIHSKIKEKDEEIANKIDSFQIPEKYTLKNNLTLNNLRRLIAIIFIILGITKMITIPAKIVFVIGGIFIFPKISDVLLRNIIFKIIIPIAFILIAFSLNIETTLTTITGTWYSDTMTLKIGEEKTEMDVIDYNGRHLLTGENKFDQGFFEIKTKYKTFRYNFDAINDTLCVLNKDNSCKYYLKRVSQKVE